MNMNPMLLFGGKGGVGKTTCSAAVALQCASLQQKTLIITSDMSPSLSDIFEEQIGDKITRVDKSLDALEISDRSIMNRWKEQFGPDFHDIISSLIDLEGLDSESRHQLLDYIGSAPSLKEETMLDLIVDLSESGTYDRIIWDTAPAGETLNLINMPGFIRKHLRAGARVFEGLDKIGKKIVGKRSISKIMDEWIIVSERISQFVHSNTSFIVVANPEALVVNQTLRLIKTLHDYSLNIHGIVINRVIGDTDSEYLRGLKEIQRKYIIELSNIAKEMPTASLEFSMDEIKGKPALREIGRALFTELKL